MICDNTIQILSVLKTMKIVRQENLPIADNQLYELTIEFRKEFLWPKDGSCAFEYKEDDEGMVFFLALDIDTNSLEGMVGYDPKTNRLRQLIISPKCQGRGIGTNLVKHIKNEARRQGKNNLRVNAWMDSLNFYLKRGFILIDDPYLSKGVWCQKMELQLNG